MSESPALPASESRLERLFNPVLYKDLLTVSVNPTSGAGARLFLYSLLFAVPLMGLAWGMTFAAGPWRFAARPVLLGFCALLSFFHISVAVPAATAFALERDRNTLESLVISPLSPWRLVLGKLLTALAVGAMGKAAVVPALAVAVALGGADVGFVPRFLLVLIAVDVSLASFALHLGARRRELNTKVGWIKAQTSQTQLVMQATVGMSLLTSLVPIYGAIFLIPLAVQSGIHLPGLLSDLAPAGVLHPLAALLVWGDADLLGLRVPVWVLAVLFHVLLALPFLADSAEAQKTEGSERGHMPRLFALPVLLLSLLLTASVASRVGVQARVLLSLGLPTILMLGAASSASHSKDPTARVTPLRLLQGLLPPRALESAPERALGYVVIVGVCCAPLALWGTGAASSSLLGCGGLLVVALSAAVMGARMTARAQEKEDEAFLDALARRGQAKEPKPEDKEKSKDKDTTPKRPLGYLLAGAILLACVPFFLLGLSRNGALPALGPFEPVLITLTAVGVALCPLSSLLPSLADPAVFGTDAVGNGLMSWGLDPTVLFVLHVLVYVFLAAAALATLRKPVDLEEAMGRHRRVEEAASLGLDAGGDGDHLDGDAVEDAVPA